MAGQGDIKLGITLSLKDLATKGVEEFRRGFQRGMADVKGDAESAGSALKAGMTSISTQLATLQRLVIAYQAAAGALRAGVEVIRAADDFKALNARLLLATGSLQGAGRALNDVRRIAAANGQELGAVGTLYGRLAAAIKDMGGSQSTAAKATEAVTLALRISGAGAAEAASATLQLSQAFASGTLRGDEFNSINEAAPRIMQALADHLGVTRGKLREMAEAGQLTSEVLSGALLGSLEKLRGEAAQLPDTMEQAATRMKNAWIETVAKFDASTGATAQVSGALNALAGNMDAVVDAAKTLGEGVLIILAGRMLTAWRAASVGLSVLGALGAAAGGLFRAFGGVPALLLAVGVAAWKLGWSIGEYLAAENMAANARQKSASELGAILGQTIEYKDALVRTRAEVDALTNKELQGYRDKLKGALAYYNALYEAEARKGDKGDKKAEAAAKAQVDIYFKAISDLKPILAARAKLEKDHTAKLKGAQEELIPQLKAALDAQTKLYQAAGRAVEDIQKKKTDALKNQAAFEAELLAGPKKKPEQTTLSDVGAGIADARQSTVSGDTDAALKKVEALRENLRAMKDAGTESSLVLSGLAKEIAGIENTALSKAGDKAAKDEEAAKNKLIELQGIAKTLEAIKIGIDQAAAEAALKATQTKLQAFADANPIMQRVIIQAQDKMLLDANAPFKDAPKKADGGLLSGPGSDTSDNLLAWLSPGEFVMRAAAVRQWGAGNLAAMNALRMPKFAGGGMAARAVSSIPRFAAGGAVSGAAALQPINLTLPGIGSYPMQASPDVADSLGRAIRMAALKRGSR